jgi:1-acyl-sn-glycerol-3-phosphate acyltransferase
VSPGRLLRRGVTLPAVLLLHVVLVATAPLTVAAAVVVSLAARSSRPLRSVVLVICYAAIELVTVPRILRLRRSGAGADDPQWQALLRHVVDVAYTLLRRVLGVRVQLEAGSASVDEVAQADGLVVLARHAGPGDTLLIAWLLVAHYGLRLRVVLKRVLRVIPAVDLAGDVLPFCFVGVRRSRTLRGVARIAESTHRGDALLLFPEGGNYSSERRRNALRKLARRGEPQRARRWRRHEHTLPPHVAGVTAALTAAPHASVLLLAHSGLGPRGRGRPWWRLPVDHDVTARTRLLDASAVPRDEDRIEQWLDDAWAGVDRWVSDHADDDGSASRAAASP